MKQTVPSSWGKEKFGTVEGGEWTVLVAGESDHQLDSHTPSLLLRLLNCSKLVIYSILPSYDTKNLPKRKILVLCFLHVCCISLLFAYELHFLFMRAVASCSPMSFLCRFLLPMHFSDRVNSL
jgi:hypothetical protein